MSSKMLNKILLGEIQYPRRDEDKEECVRWDCAAVMTHNFVVQRIKSHYHNRDREKRQPCDEVVVR